MKVVRRSPNKFWVFIDGKAFVIRLSKEVGLIPRWRIVSSLAFSCFAAGIALSLGAVLPGAILSVVALFLCWAASR